MKTFDEWLYAVKCIARHEGLTEEDTETFDGQSCWEGYHQNSYSPWEAWETETSYA